MYKNIMEKKKIISILVIIIVLATGCSFSTSQRKETLHIAAASSIEKCMEEELIPLFLSHNRNVSIVGEYDSSGKLQTQIEEGELVDLFIPASTIQMEGLEKKGLLYESYEFIGNKIVFIVPAGEESQYKNFEDIVQLEEIAMGDPDIVPAGYFAKEALTNLGIWEEVESKARFGTNIAEVLNWVAESSVKGGIVYATDVNNAEEVSIIEEAPDYCVEDIIYPIGILSSSAQKEVAKKFVKFLKSDQSKKILEKYGFLIKE